MLKKKHWKNHLHPERYDVKKYLPQTQTEKKMPIQNALIHVKTLFGVGKRKNKLWLTELFLK